MHLHKYPEKMADQYKSLANSLRAKREKWLSYILRNNTFIFYPLQMPKQPTEEEQAKMDLFKEKIFVLKIRDEELHIKGKHLDFFMGEMQKAPYNQVADAMRFCLDKIFEQMNPKEGILVEKNEQKILTKKEEPLQIIK